MTTFRSPAARAIARSRGHIKQAEQDFSNERHYHVRFSVEKANHALNTGMLHEAARAAEAQEMRAVVEILKLDPESELGELLTSNDVQNLETKLLQYVRRITGSEGEDSDE